MLNQSQKNAKFTLKPQSLNFSAADFINETKSTPLALNAKTKISQLPIFDQSDVSFKFSQAPSTKLDFPNDRLPSPISLIPKPTPIPPPQPTKTSLLFSTVFNSSML